VLFCVLVFCLSSTCVASVSGLSILDSTFGFLYRLCTSFILSVFTYVVCSFNVKKQSINRKYYLVLFNILICFVMMYYINVVCVNYKYIAYIHSGLSQPNCLNVVTDRIGGLIFFIDKFKECFLYIYLNISRCMCVEISVQIMIA